MSRQEKKTRIKMLPPKVQLQQRDALTGSYPTITRFSTDGRTGNYPISYNDLQTIVFTSNSTNTSWQNNLVAYWTMQRNIENNGLIGGIALQTEKNINNFSKGFLDATLTNNFATSLFTKYGISEDFPFIGKAYDINLTTITQSHNLTIPNFIPNKNYNFKPSFSFFAQAEQSNTTRVSALVQYVDSNKSLCAFTGSWNEGPSPFTIAGWFKINDKLNEQNTYELIQGPNRFSNYINSYAADYFLGIVDSPTPSSKQIYFYVYSGSAGSLQASTNELNERIFFNNWFHIAATYDGKTKRSVLPNPRGTADSNSLKIYLNGQKISNAAGSIGNFSGFLSGSLPQYGVSFLNFIKGAGTMTATGSVAETVFFNKELSAQEISEIYNSQVPLNKKGRILAGTSINIDNNPYPVDSSEYMTSFNGDGMLITGSIVKGIGDNPEWVHFTPGQEMSPFRDNDQPAVDGKSVRNSFYATGSAVSDVGEGFTSPLWSKNKIEIDISTASSTSLLTFCQGTGQTKNLAYYNFSSKTWEPLAGNHGPATNGDVGVAKMAFTPSLMTWTNGLEPGNKGSASTSFGFPFHSLYAATSSQLLSMKEYIKEPFLLEKVVVLFTASFHSGIDEVFKKDEQYDFDGNPIEFSSSYAVNNFFILNQRRYNLAEKNIFSGFYDDTLSYYINTKIPNGNVITIRDLIGYGSIASFNNAFGWAYTASVDPQALYAGRWQRDLNIIDTIISDATKSLWSGQYELSFSIKSPTKFGDTNESFVSGYPKALAWQTFDGGVFADGLGHIQNGGSLGLGEITPSGRNFVSPLKTLNPIVTTTPTYGGIKVPIVPVSEYTKVNPYLLMPNDNIVLGWSAATMDDYSFIGNSTITYQTASILTIAAGPAKIVLYGSYIRENKEYNDGTNQLLSSDSVHEVIE